MARHATWICAVCFALLANACVGQDALLEELYGRGVHAYFSQNSRDAFESLAAAIKSGSRDPRAYYFRGLTLNRLGRPEEAKDDFRKAAELEMLGGEPYSVGKALERIQGTERALLESHRRAARLAIHNTMSAQERARYEQGKRAEGDALRGGSKTAPLTAPRVNGPDATDPFSAPAAPPAPLPTPAAAAPVPAPATAPSPVADPFAGPAAERPLPAEAPPQAAPAPPPPAAKPPAAPATDPFADPPAAAPAPAPPAAAPADPFATPVPATSAPATPKPAADDPFAAPQATPPAPAATPAPPPAAPVDPFATPAAPPAPAPAAP